MKRRLSLERIEEWEAEEKGLGTKTWSVDGVGYRA